MRREVSGIILIVLALLFCPTGMAQGPLPDASWDACRKAPTRACILDEAILLALSVEPSLRRPTQLGKLAELQAAIGNVPAALGIAQSIPPDQPSRVTALSSIGGAQARLGQTNEAKETFDQAHQIALALKDQLDSAEVLQTIAEAEAKAGLTTEAASTLQESLKLTETLDIRASSCAVYPLPEIRLGILLKTLAEQQAKAGNVSDALQAARLIKYHLPSRARALQAIAEIQAQHGPRNEAGLILKEAFSILKEALQAVHASQKPPERPTCPSVHRAAPSGDLYMEMLSRVGIAQAKMGLAEDAAATFDAALQFVPTVRQDGPLWSADVTRSLALSTIAEAQSEAGFKMHAAPTFERAVQAASKIYDARYRIQGLAKLGRAQYKSGRSKDASGTFEKARKLAWAPENAGGPAHGLVEVLEAEVDGGLAETGFQLNESVLIEAGEAIRLIADKSRRILPAGRLAHVYEKAGRLQDAVDIFAEALGPFDRTNFQDIGLQLLVVVLRGVPGRPQGSRLISELAPQVVEVVQSVKNDLRRAQALIFIAEASQN